MSELPSNISRSNVRPIPSSEAKSGPRGLSLSLVALLFFCLGFVSTRAEQTDIFPRGFMGYHTCRIPALVVATNGTVLAFCEGRKNGAGDTGKIDLIVRSSKNGGRTWSEGRLLRADGENVCGNPAPVVDQITGTIILFTTWNLGSDTEKMIMNGSSKDARRVFVMESRDNGLTWSAAREVTADVKKSHWRWYATGPCNGIQLKSGRLLIPANHSDHSDPDKHPFRSHVIYSDDHGVSWRLGGIEEEKTNESTLVALSNGIVLHNMRSYDGKNARAIATSVDGGLTFSPVTLDTNLVESVCQASILRYSADTILFSNPASKKRENMTIRVSRDDCKNWTASMILHAGPSAYSCLARLADGTILCLYERGEKSPYEKITLARLTLDELK